LFFRKTTLYAHHGGCAPARDGAAHAVVRLVLVGLAALTVCAVRADALQASDASLHAIRRAFLDNDGAGLARQFWTPGKVHVAIAGLQPGGFLGPGPLRALLGRVCRETRTVAFDYEPGVSTAPALERADDRFVKARWTYRDNVSGVVRSVDVYLALRRSPEAGEWRIVQLRASP
jgi:hypothetical protein